jgi:hypothetical protein
VDHDTVFGGGSSARDGVHVLRGLLISGLVLTAGTGNSALHESVRAIVPLGAGLVFGIAVATTRRASPGSSLRWIAHLTVLWLATFSPAMWGNREVLRTSAVAGGVAILVLRGGTSRVVAWTAVALAAAVAVISPLGPSWLEYTSELQYALGGAWPRGWGSVARDGALFLLGVWTSGGRAILAVARWRGVATPFRALGRMPLTTLAVQYLAVSSLPGVGDSGARPDWVGPAAAVMLLLAQSGLAVLWLRILERGPCEQLLYLAHKTAYRLPLRLRAVWSPS